MRASFVEPGIIGAVVLFPVLAAFGADTPETTASWDRYKVIVERSIFLRDRTPRSERVRQAPVYRPERDIVLAGIVEQDGVRFALLENLKSGSVTRVRAGDAVAQGVVERMDIDAIYYRSGGEPVRVALGQNLDGASASRLSSVLAEAAAEMVEGAPVAKPAAATGPAEGAVIERLRQRRQSEVGGR
jgi:hypothetical protein